MLSVVNASEQVVQAFYVSRLAKYTTFEYGGGVVDGEVYFKRLMQSGEPDYADVTEWFNNQDSVLAILRLIWLNKNKLIDIVGDARVEGFGGSMLEKSELVLRNCLSIVYTDQGRKRLDELRSYEGDSVFMKSIGLPICDLEIFGVLLTKILGKTLSLVVLRAEKRELKKVFAKTQNSSIYLSTNISRIALWESLLYPRISDVYFTRQELKFILGSSNLLKALCLCPVENIDKLWRRIQIDSSVSSEMSVSSLSLSSVADDDNDEDEDAAFIFHPSNLSLLDIPSFYEILGISGISLDSAIETYDDYIASIKYLLGVRGVGHEEAKIIIEESFKAVQNFNWLITEDDTLTARNIGVVIPVIKKIAELIQERIMYIDRNGILYINSIIMATLNQASDSYERWYMQHPFLAFAMTALVRVEMGDEAKYVGNEFFDDLKVNGYVYDITMDDPVPVFGPVGSVIRRRHANTHTDCCSN